MDFKLSCVAEAGRRNFSIAKLMGIFVDDLLGQNLVLIYIITGVHKVGLRCSRGWGGVIVLEKTRGANVLVQPGGCGCAAECPSLDSTAASTSYMS